MTSCFWMRRMSAYMSASSESHGSCRLAGALILFIREENNIKRKERSNNEIETERCVFTDDNLRIVGHNPACGLQ